MTIGPVEFPDLVPPLEPDQVVGGLVTLHGTSAGIVATAKATGPGEMIVEIIPDPDYP